MRLGPTGGRALVMRRRETESRDCATTAHGTFRLSWSSGKLTSPRSSVDIDGVDHPDLDWQGLPSPGRDERHDRRPAVGGQGALRHRSCRTCSNGLQDRYYAGNRYPTRGKTRAWRTHLPDGGRDRLPRVRPDDPDGGGELPALRDGVVVTICRRSKRTGSRPAGRASRERREGDYVGCGGRAKRVRRDPTGVEPRTSRARPPRSLRSTGVVQSLRGVTTAHFRSQGHGPGGS